MSATQVGYWQCHNCKILIPFGAVHSCTEQPSEQPSAVYFTAQGWQCPRCLKIHAPWITGCVCLPRPAAALPAPNGDQK